MKSSKWFYVLLFPSLVWLSNEILATRYADNDLFARVAVGRIIQLQAAVPTNDPFSFTTVKDTWYDHEWLSGLIFYHVSQLGGDAALLICNLLFLWATALMLLLAQRDETVHPAVRVLWVFLLLISSLSVWIKVIRARVFTFLFLAVLFWAFSRWRKGSRSLLLACLLPLMFAVWVNAHGGFVVGWGLFGIFAALSIWDRKLPMPQVIGSFAASAAAGFINPYGLGYLVFIFEAVTKDRSLIVEWAPVPLFSWELFYSGHAVFLLVLAVLIVGMRRARRLLSVEALLFLALTLGYGLRSQRLMPLFYVTAAVYGAGCFSAFLRQPAVLDRWIHPQTWIGALRMVAAAAICWAVIICTARLQELPKLQLDYSSYPVEAMAWLNHNSDGGNILAPFNQASYVLWRGAPKFRVAIDGRYEEVYPDRTIERALSALNPKDPEHELSLKLINPSYILLWKTDPAPFAPEWRPIYEDSRTTLLSRTPHPSTPAPPPAIWSPPF